MRKSMIAVIVAVLAGPAAAQVVVDDSFPAGLATVEEMHAAVSPQLSDPDPAQYRGLVLTGGDGFMSICGWVGAEEGGEQFQRFVYRVETREAWVLSSYEDSATERETATANGCPAEAFG